MKRIYLVLLIFLLSAPQAWAVPVQFISSTMAATGEVDGTLITLGPFGEPIFTTIADGYNVKSAAPLSETLDIHIPDSHVYLYAHSETNYFSVEAEAEAYDDAISGWGEALAVSAVSFKPKYNSIAFLTIDYSLDTWGYVTANLIDTTAGVELFDDKYSGGGLSNDVGDDFIEEIEWSFNQSHFVFLRKDHVYSMTLAAYKNSNEDGTLMSSVQVNGLNFYRPPFVPLTTDLPLRSTSSMLIAAVAPANDSMSSIMMESKDLNTVQSVPEPKALLLIGITIWLLLMFRDSEFSEQGRSLRTISTTGNAR